MFRSHSFLCTMTHPVCYSISCPALFSPQSVAEMFLLQFKFKHKVVAVSRLMRWWGDQCLGCLVGRTINGGLWASLSQLVGCFVGRLLGCMSMQKPLDGFQRLYSTETGTVSSRRLSACSTVQPCSNSHVVT